jgi:hypothetical protein
MEAICLLLEEPPGVAARSIPPSIAGKDRLVGEMGSPLFPESSATPPLFDRSRLLDFLDELEQMPFSIRTTEEMNADIQAERDAWD